MHSQKTKSCHDVVSGDIGGFHNENPVPPMTANSNIVATLGTQWMHDTRGAFGSENESPKGKGGHEIMVWIKKFPNCLSALVQIMLSFFAVTAGVGLSSQIKIWDEHTYSESSMTALKEVLINPGKSCFPIPTDRPLMLYMSYTFYRYPGGVAAAIVKGNELQCVPRTCSVVPILVLQTQDTC